MLRLEGKFSFSAAINHSFSVSASSNFLILQCSINRFFVLLYILRTSKNLDQKFHEIKPENYTFNCNVDTVTTHNVLQFLIVI